MVSTHLDAVGEDWVMGANRRRYVVDLDGCKANGQAALLAGAKRGGTEKFLLQLNKNPRPASSGVRSGERSEPLSG